MELNALLGFLLNSLMDGNDLGIRELSLELSQEKVVNGIRPNDPP